MPEPTTSASPRRPNPARYAMFKINVTAIPTIAKLREELDYGRAHVAQDIKFWNEVRSYPGKFVASSGIPGQELLKWRQRSHQNGFLEMAHSFLEKEGKGREYWPDSPRHENYRKLQYSREASKIRRILIQLFLKANQGTKWKGSHKGPADRTSRPSQAESTASFSGSSDTRSSPHAGPAATRPTEPRQQSASSAAGQRGLNRDDPINLDDSVFEGIGPFPWPDVGAWDAASTSTPEPSSYTDRSFRPVFDKPIKDRAHHNDNQVKQEQAPVAQMEDLYDGPVSPPAKAPEDVRQASSSDKRPAPSEHDDEHLRAKRHRSGPQDDDDPFDFFPAQRHRNPPPAPGIVTGDEYDEALGGLRQSPESVAASEVDNSHSLYQPTETVLSPPREESAPAEDVGHVSRYMVTLGARPARIASQEVPTATGEASLLELPNPSPVPDRKQSEDKPHQQHKPRALPKVSITYSVMVSRDLNSVWTPSGSFQRKTLAELTSQLPARPARLQSLTFRLETPGGMKYENSVGAGDGEAFEAMKARFREKVLDSRRAHVGSTKTLKFEIVITPQGCDEDDNDGDVDEKYADDDDLEW